MKAQAMKKLSSLSIYLIVLLLSGCATQQYHNWNENNVAAPAIISSIETVLLESINGRVTGSAFIGQEHTYELAPGTYVLVVTYADLFDITADDFEKVRSNPLKLTLKMEAGKKYRLSHKKVEKLEQARKFAQKPSIEIIDSDTGKAVEVAIEYTTPKSLLSRLASMGESEQVFASEYLNKDKPKVVVEGAAERVADREESDSSATGNELSALKMLQFSWQQASQKEREEFLRWIKQ